MADKKISELPKINLISGSEVILPIVHDGTTQKMDVSTFAVFTSQWSATTGSNTFIGNQTITGNTSIGGNLVVAGKLTAQELFTEITSASILFESGSTIFGDTADDTHTITGTIILNGLALGTPELMAQTASQEAVNLGISSVTGSINTTTSSFNSVFQRISSTTGSINTTTSSFDSVFLGISSVTGALNEFTQSLNSLSGSFATTGSNTFIGNQNITGSLSISAGEFNVTTGSGNMTSSLIFDHTQNDGVTLGLRHNDRLSLADHTFNVNVWAAGVYTTFVRNGTPYSILNVEAFDDNKIYLYRDTRLYNKSLVIDNNLTVQKGIVIGSGSLSIERGQFSVISGSGDLTSSIGFLPVDYDLTQGASVFEVRHTNNIYPEELALKLSVNDTAGTLFFEKNGSVYNVLQVGGNSNNLFISRDTRLLGKGLTIDNELLVKQNTQLTGSLIVLSGITGSLLSTNGVVSSSNQLFELNGQTGSQDTINFNISVVTSSIDAHILGISIYTASANTTNTSIDAHILAQSIQTASQDLVNYNISVVTSSIDAHILKQSTQTGSQDLVNLGISSVTGSLIGITNTLMAFTAALDNTYATDAQLYQLYQATASIQFATASLNVQTGSQDLVNYNISIVTSSIDAHVLTQATQTGSQDLVNYNISVVTSSIDSHILKQATQTGSQDLVNLGISSVTGSLIGITNGLMAFTAALDSTYATDAQLYQLYHATASLNIQTGSQDLVNLGISTYTGSQNVINSSVDAHILEQATQTGSQDLVNLGISIVTSSIDAHILGISTYTSSQNVINTSVDAHILGVSTYTGSNELWKEGIRGEVNGLEAYTSSLKGAIEVSGQNVNVLGMITAQQFNVTYVSSSVMYQSGSNKFGNSNDDKHEFTGSIDVSGSITASGNLQANQLYVGGATTSTGLIGASEAVVQNELGIQFGDATGTYMRLIANGANSNTAIVAGAFSGAEPPLDLIVGGTTKVSIKNDGAVNITGNITGSGNLTANKVAIGSTVTPTAQLEVYGQQKWFTSTGDGSELRGLFAPGGAADDPQLTMYKADGVTAGIKLTADGIDFSADGNAAGMTSELLDDYEEGTWTPVISDGTNDATMTPTYNRGQYIKVGALVTLSAYVLTDSLGSVTGTIRITGLPFTNGSGYGFLAGGVAGAGAALNLTAGQNVTCTISTGANYIILNVWNSAAGSTQMDASEWSSNGQIQMGITYLTN